MKPLRDQAMDAIASNALALEPMTDADVSGAREDPGAFEVALGPIAKRALKGLMHASGADKGFDRTVGTLTNGRFSPQEIQTLEDRVLDKAQKTDVGALYGVQEGVPVYLSPNQKAVIDRLMGQLGEDPLARRARDAYGGAVSAGNVRVR